MSWFTIPRKECGSVLDIGVFMCMADVLAGSGVMPFLSMVWLYYISLYLLKPHFSLFNIMPEASIFCRAVCSPHVALGFPKDKDVIYIANVSSLKCGSFHFESILECWKCQLAAN